MTEYSILISRSIKLFKLIIKNTFDKVSWEKALFFLPAYYIFNDEELNKIIALKPMNIESLKELLPSIKVKVHGANIIKIVNESK